MRGIQCQRPRFCMRKAFKSGRNDEKNRNFGKVFKEKLKGDWLVKIVHLMLANFYIDNYSYQENLLPKYHKLAGHDVEIIASLFTFDENGKGAWLEKGTKYENEYGIPVTRLEFKKVMFTRRFRWYVGLEAELERAQPDIIFIHGVQFCDIGVVAKYLKKHKNVRAFADNHADFSNSAKNWASKHIQHRIIWRACSRKINPCVMKFYGVLPSRVEFLINEYKIPCEKVELLVMGADDEAVKNADDEAAKKAFRHKFGVKDDDFLLVYGGKTDNSKRQVMLLMDAVNEIDNPKLKLIVFGSILAELKNEIQKRCSERVKYIGWLPSAESYKCFAAANIAAFPGRHSVFWEQVVGQGIPLLVKKWDGTTHIDCGGNVKFLTQDSTEEIKAAIQQIMSGENYEKMLAAAQKAKNAFMYGDIAQRSISAALKRDSAKNEKVYRG